MSIIEKLGITPAPWEYNEYGEEYEIVAGENCFVWENCYIKYRRVSPENAQLIATSPEIIKSLIENKQSLDMVADLEINMQAEGCGLEDRGITDRYEAMAYGWEQALFRVSELLNETGFVEIIEKSTGKTWEEIKELL